MLVVLTETYCNKVNVQITQRDDFIQAMHEINPRHEVPPHVVSENISTEILKNSITEIQYRNII